VAEGGSGEGRRTLLSLGRGNKKKRRTAVDGGKKEKTNITEMSKLSEKRKETSRGKAGEGRIKGSSMLQENTPAVGGGAVSDRGKIRK